MFIAALLTIAKMWKQPKYPLMENGLLKHGIHLLMCNFKFLTHLGPLSLSVLKCQAYIILEL